MKGLIRIFIIFSLGMFFVTAASADTGPKPSTTVYVNNLESGNYYGFFLTDEDAPMHQYINDEYLYYIKECLKEDPYYEEKYEQCLYFYENVKDVDGFNVLDYYITYEENATSIVISCGYWAPDKFKVGVLNAETMELFISDITYKDTYFSTYEIDFNNSNELNLTSIVNTGDVPKVIIQSLIRLGVTLIIEIVIALMFLIFKKNLLYILLTNIVTQIFINVFLIFNGLTLIFDSVNLFLIGEAIVFVSEALIYVKALECSKKKAIIYAITANLVSMLIGMITVLF